MNAFGRVLAPLVLLVATADLRAQDAATPPAKGTDKMVSQPSAPPSRAEATPLKLTVVVSKYQGDKKTSSLPYSMSLYSNAKREFVRMGARIPYRSGAGATDGKPAPMYSYKDIGLFLDASATPADGGGFRVDLTVSDSSIMPTSQLQGAPDIPSVPIFRNISFSNTVLLRDGQTTQVTTAADPISGELLRIDLTLNVVK